MTPDESAGLPEWLTGGLPDLPPPDLGLPSIPDLPDAPPIADATPPPKKIVPARGWIADATAVVPNLEDDGTLIAFRVVIRPDVDLADCTVRFPLPPGVRQVQAARKPTARKGWLTWSLGPIRAGAEIPITLKFPRSPLTEPLLQSPPPFEVSRLALPAAKLTVAAAAPATAEVGTVVVVSVTVTNAGDAPAAACVVRPAGGEELAELEVPPLDPGAAFAGELRLTVPRPGPVEWPLAVVLGGIAAATTTATTTGVAAELAVTIHHPPTARVDATFAVEIELTNPGTVMARGVAVAFDVPDELGVEAVAGGTFAAARAEWPAADLPPGGTRIVSLTLRGYAAGLARVRARAEYANGPGATAAAQFFCEVDARTTSQTLDQLLASLDVAAPDADADAAPAAPVVETGERHVVFTVAGSGYAMPIAGVREVVRPPNVTPVPDTPAWLAGVANVRGDVLPVVDLSAFLGTASTAPRRGLVIAQTADAVIGLLVEDVVGIRRFPAAVGGAIAASNPAAAVLAGVADHQNKLVPVFDVARLVAATAG